MIVGLIIALVGVVGGLIGAVSMPWVDADVVTFKEGVGGFGVFAWPTGIAALAFFGVCAALLVIALAVPHRRKLMTIFAMIASAVVFVLAMATPFTMMSAIPEVIKGGMTTPASDLAMYYGFHCLFFGTLVTIFGCAWVLGSVGSYKTSDKVLRVAHLWHGKIVSETTFTERHPVRIGGGVDCDFVVPLTADPESDASIVLFRPQPNDMASVMLKGMKGRVNIGKKLMTPEEAVAKAGSADVLIDRGDWGTIDFGFNQIFFNYLHPDVVVGRGGAMKTNEGTFVAALVASLFAAVGIWITSQFMWDPMDGIERQALEKRQMTLVEVMGKEKEEVNLDVVEEEEEVVEQSDDKFGDPTDMSPDNGPKRDSAMAEKVDVKNIGLADLLSNKLGQSGAISSILADNTDQFENRMAVAMSGTESDLMVGYGANGMGFKGTGASGGGTGGYGRIHGLGNVDTGGGSGMRAGLGKKGARKVGQMKIDGMQGSGFCQKGNIEAVVKQRAGAIRACYEQELQLHDGLSGKVAVRWTINLEGKVESASVTNSTIGSSKVESCIMTVIRRMRFQAPEGGICVVQWPFVFSPG